MRSSLLIRDHLPTAEDGVPICAVEESPGQWICTRPQHDGGRHVAHDHRGEVCFVWK